jgi:hypothetical protein
VPYDSQTYGWSPDELRHLVADSGFALGDFRGVGVLDKLAARLGRLGRLVPLGGAVSRPLGRLGLAPSLFGAADAVAARGGSDAGFFGCPVCTSAVVSGADGYDCQECRRSFRLRDGILDFRI